MRLIECFSIFECFNFTRIAHRYKIWICQYEIEAHYWLELLSAAVQKRIGQEAKAATIVVTYQTLIVLILQITNSRQIKWCLQLNDLKRYIFFPLEAFFFSCFTFIQVKKKPSKVPLPTERLYTKSSQRVYMKTRKTVWDLFVFFFFTMNHAILAWILPRRITCKRFLWQRPHCKIDTFDSIFHLYKVRWHLVITAKWRPAFAANICWKN